MNALASASRQGAVLDRLSLPAARSPGRMALRRFLHHRLALVGLVAIALIALLSLLAPIVAPSDPFKVDLAFFRKPPNLAHPLGTDSAGRDVLSRLLFAGQVSLYVGLSAALISTGIGLVLGSVAGAYGGWADATIMRLTDIVLSFPALVVIITVVALIGPSVQTVIAGIGLFYWPTACRIVRGVALSVREQDFFIAARALGASDRHVIARHLVPSVLSPLTVTATFAVAQAILLEAALSFLGLGVRPPQPSWGNMLNEAQSLTILESMPWLWLPPGLAIALTVLAINFIGDGLRDALDPRQRL
ncbi:MAG: ABC transporter permease [Chloroflexota bacterium]|nr:ABC transporter permease [Chloroflexota bacterium]